MIKYYMVGLLILVLATVAVTVSGQDFKILIPDQEISGVTTVNIADLDNDGLPDIAAFEGGKHARGRQTFHWYRAPRWEKLAFDPDFNPGPFTGDSEFADVDRDGDQDLILPVDKHSGDLDIPACLYWFENPVIPTGNAGLAWSRHTIDSHIPNGLHLGDLDVADLDGNDKIDVIVRHLGNNNEVLLYFQDSPDDWQAVKLPGLPEREGLDVFDLDNDNVPDLVMNGYVLFADNPRKGDYHKVVFDENWMNREGNLSNSTKNGYADLNGDGKKDLLVSPAEGSEVYLAWYDLPDDARNKPWKKHIIEDYFTANHQALARDFDLDGDMDVFVGLSFGKKGTYLWLNAGDGLTWTRKDISGEYGMYYGVTGDLGNDGDMDIVGPNTYSRESKIIILENQASQGRRVWERLEDMPEKKTEHASFIHDGKIHVVGGIEMHTGQSPSLLSFNLADQVWTREGEWPDYVHHITTNASAYGEEVWICGGKPDDDNSGTRRVAVYNASTGKWRTGPELPEVHWGGPAVVVGDQLHVIGGAQGKKLTTQHHYVLDLKHERRGWKEASPLPKPVVHAAGVELDGEIWIIGGEIEHAHTGDRSWVQIYNPEIESWREGPALPRPRSHLEWSTFTWEGKIYSCNGVDSAKPNGIRGQDGVYVYDPAAGSWKLWGLLPHNFTSISALAADGFIYISGGGYNDWFDGSMKETWRTRIE
jgi:hypothetical protein